MTVKEKELWLFEERLCLRCLSPRHQASVCKENVKWRIFGSRRRPDLLYLSSEERKDNTKKVEKAANTEPNINAKYTAICKDVPEGLLVEKYCWLISSEKRRSIEFTQLGTIRATLRLFPPS